MQFNVVCTTLFSLQRHIVSCQQCLTVHACIVIFLHFLPSAPPAIETDCSAVPILAARSTPFVQLTAGCNLCVEVQQMVEVVEVLCTVTGISRMPVNCSWQIGGEPLVGVPGRLDILSGSILISNLMNPPESSELNFLQTYTCICSNLDGRAVASSTIRACCELTCLISESKYEWDTFEGLLSNVFWMFPLRSHTCFNRVLFTCCELTCIIQNGSMHFL